MAGRTLGAPEVGGEGGATSPSCNASLSRGCGSTRPVASPGAGYGRGSQHRCNRREGASEAAPGAVGQAVGGGCQSGWGRLLSVTSAIEAGTWRQGSSGCALAGRPGRGHLPPFPCIPARRTSRGPGRTGRATRAPTGAITWRRRGSSRPTTRSGTRTRTPPRARRSSRWARTVCPVVCGALPHAPHPIGHRRGCVRGGGGVPSSLPWTPPPPPSGPSFCSVKNFYRRAHGAWDSLLGVWTPLALSSHIHYVREGELIQFGTHASGGGSTVHTLRPRVHVPRNRHLKEAAAGVGRGVRRAVWCAPPPPPLARVRTPGPGPGGFVSFWGRSSCGACSAALRRALRRAVRSWNRGNGTRCETVVVNGEWVAQHFCPVPRRCASPLCLPDACFLHPQLRKANAVPMTPQLIALPLRRTGRIPSAYGPNRPT